MKKEWSPEWTGSSQPRKQRKYRCNAPLHIRRKFLSAHLSPELRERFGTRSMVLRKGDGVLVMKGEFKGIRGSVERVDTKRSKIYMEEIKVKKVDGSEVQKALEPSNLMITKLSLDDKRRQSVIERSVAKESASEVRKKKGASRNNQSREEQYQKGSRKRKGD